MTSSILRHEGQSKTIVLDRQEVIYTVRRSPRAQRVSLKVGFDSGLVVVVPIDFNLRHLDAILDAKQQWILRTLKKVSPGSKSKQLKSGDSVLYLGRSHVLTVQKRVSGFVGVETRGSRIVVTAREDGHVRELLVGWMRKHAKDLITDRVQTLSKDLGLSYNQIFIKDQKTRWGSCSHKKNLNFSWRLIMTPPRVMDYVIIHELVHLVEMNHSKVFWSTVESWCGDYRKHRRWLKQHEAVLKSL